MKPTSSSDMTGKLSSKETRALRDRVSALSLELGPLTFGQKDAAVNSADVIRWGVHYESRGDNLCQSCGHRWHDRSLVKKVNWWGSDDPEKTVTCPHCGKRLRLDIRAHRTDAWYHLILQEKDGMAVARTVLVNAQLVSGSPARHTVCEVCQVWYDGKGNYVRIARPANLLDWSKDSFDIYSVGDLKVNTMTGIVARLQSFSATVCDPDFFARRGFTGDGHGMSVNYVIHQLFTDNRFETLWKLGAFAVLSARNYTALCGKYWKQVLMLANSDRKDSYDLTTWKDYLDQVEKLHNMAVAAGRKTAGYDLNNRFYVLPEDLHEAHQRYTRLIQRKMEEQRAIDRLKRDAESLPALIEAGEEAFEKAKSAYFGIAYSNGRFRISTLSSIQEYFDYGKDLRHCVFHNHYWEKKDTLVLGVTDLGSGRRVANIEMQLDNGDILQCYGKDNIRPDCADELSALVTQNFPLYVKARNKRKRKSSKPALAPVFA